MQQSGLPPGLEQFITSRIDSVELLEVLIHLQKNSSSAVAAEALSKSLYSNVSSIVMRLDTLASVGLAVKDPGGTSMYQYAPASPADDQLVRNLSLAYMERPVAVIAAIMSRPKKNVQAFSDAFRLRNGGDTT